MIGFMVAPAGRTDGPEPSQPIRCYRIDKEVPTFSILPAERPDHTARAMLSILRFPLQPGSDGCWTRECAAGQALIASRLLYGPHGGASTITNAMWQTLCGERNVDTLVRPILKIAKTTM